METSWLVMIMMFDYLFYYVENVQAIMTRVKEPVTISTWWNIFPILFIIAILGLKVNLLYSASAHACLGKDGTEMN